MKNDLPYFSHDNDARNHPKMKALRAQYGIAGYGLFWMLNEIVSQSEGARLDLSKKINRAAVAGELGMSIMQFDEFLAFLSDPEYDLVNYIDGILTTDRTQEDYSVVISKREKNKRQYHEKRYSAAENNNSAAENDDSADRIDTEQSRAEENRILTSKQAVKSNPARTEPADDSACLPDDIKIIKAKIKAAPFQSSFSNTDLVAFSLRIKKTGIDSGFVDYCIKRAGTGSKTEKPAGMFKAGLLTYQDWLEEYRAKAPPPGTTSEYESLAPDLESCPCGNRPKVNRRLGEAMCTCGRSWTYNRDWEQWYDDSAEKTG